MALSEPSIGSTTILVGPSPMMPTSSETMVVPSMPWRRSRITRLRGRVDRGRLVAALAVADDRLALVARRQLDEHAADVLDRVAADRQPVRHSGQEQKAGDELRIEVGALLRHRLAALGDGEHVLDPGRAHQHRDLRRAGVDRAHRLVPVGRCS